MWKVKREKKKVEKAKKANRHTNEFPAFSSIDERLLPLQ